MDNKNMNALLSDNQQRQFWFKREGFPDRPPNLDETFTGRQISLDFPTHPASVLVGDVLIVCRISISKIIYIAQCQTLPQLASEEQIQQEPWRRRYSWSFQAENLSPEYGRVWNRHFHHPYRLAEEYNNLEPENRVNLNVIRRGHMFRIPRKFADFIIRQIMELD